MFLIKIQEDVCKTWNATSALKYLFLPWSSREYTGYTILYIRIMFFSAEPQTILDIEAIKASNNFEVILEKVKIYMLLNLIDTNYTSWSGIR